MDPTGVTLTGLLDGYSSGAFSAEEAVRAFVDRIEAHNGRLNALLDFDPAPALEQARSIDARRRSGEALGPLAGVPVAIKDNICRRGEPTTCCSRMLASYRPPFDATVIRRLRDAGAILLGRLNMDEFAMGSSNETSGYGPVISPWRRKDGGNAPLAPGGSSGGSAAAVAARIAPGVTGTDTGGSIRQPAAFVGISGIKPTYGRCSRWGIVAFASSLDQAGPMARDVRDCAIMLEAMAGFDPKDSTSLDLVVPSWESGLSADLRGKRVGIPREYRIEGVPEDIDRVWQQGIDWLRDAGAEIVEISLPHTRYALPTYYIIAPAEASSNLARYDGVRYGKRVQPEQGGLNDMYEATRAAGFGAEVKRRIMIGTYVLSAGFYDAYFNQAQKVRALIARDFEQVWNEVDLILTPTAPSAAFALGEKTADPIAMYLNDVFAVPASLAGLPAMSVPAGLDGQGLPLGLQLVGQALDEQSVLNAGLAIEQRAGFTHRADPWW